MVQQIHGLAWNIIAFFLIMHISHFWVHSRITHDLPEKQYVPGGAYITDLFSRMVEVFQNPWIVALYVIGCISLAWHLLHGFQSSFRTLGLHNTKYIGIVKIVGIVFSIVVPLLFALMPISIYMGWVGYNN